VNAGANLVFEVVTTAVIGGAALTGGFGSPVGTLLRTLLFGMVEQGFYFTNISSIWYQRFVGAALVVSVVINTYVRRAAVRPPAEGS
jgi:simple sugar transport system permease protein